MYEINTAEDDKSSFSNILLNFAKEIRKINGRFDSLKFDVSDYQMAQGLLSNFDVPLDFVQYKMPPYIVPEYKTMDIVSFTVVGTEIPKFYFNIVVYLNQGEINNSVVHLDNVTPITLAGVISNEVLNLALHLIICAFTEKHIKQTEALYNAGFGSF